MCRIFTRTAACRRWAATVLGIALTACVIGCDGAVLPAPLLNVPLVSDQTGVVLGATLWNATDIDATADCTALGLPATEVHAAMFEALNRYRIENGLNPLIYSQTLQDAADAHAQDLWLRGFFSHTNPDGADPPDRAMMAGFCHRYVGENIAAGQLSVAQVMDALRASPSHDANMLESDYAYVGMGFSVDANGRRYWCQLFAFDVPNLN
jgi:uncharacterized protein YkwD